MERGGGGCHGEAVPLVYRELHRLAQRYMAQERSGHTLQTTALVNEAYLRLVDTRRVGWQSRVHLFEVPARVMRRILVDWTRSRRATKRGGEATPLEPEEALVVAEAPGPDLVTLDDALQALAAVDSRQSQIVELRYFGGLTVEEVAEVLGVSSKTVIGNGTLQKPGSMEKGRPWR